jgi:hypothetical protein
VNADAASRPDMNRNTSDGHGGVSVHDQCAFSDKLTLSLNALT